MTLRNEIEKSSHVYRKEHWEHWAAALGYPAVPAHPEHIIEYISMKVDNGIVAATIKADILAISRLHRDLGEDDPVNEDIKRLLDNMMARYAPSRVVQTITRERLELIRATACLPRGSESAEKAKLRGQEDIALISTMRDAMLRLAGAKELRHGDIIVSEDGSGILKIHDDRWQDAYLSADTMEALSAIRRGHSDEDLVFDLDRKTIQDRIRKAAKYAGLSLTGFNTESPRLGMAEDLINAGFGIPAIMAAGRWRSPDFLERRFKEELAKRSPIAQLYGTAERD